MAAAAAAALQLASGGALAQEAAERADRATPREEGRRGLADDGTYLKGWTFTPPIADPEEGEEMTELDRLSRSPSGVTFGVELYDSRSDNPRIPVSVTLRALDKITATYRDLEVPIGETVAFGPLEFLPRTCSTTPPEEFPETTVFLEVFASSSDVAGERSRRATGAEPRGERGAIVLPGQEAPAPPALFRGWMFASTPSLNAMEHPVYDVWVIDCKMKDPEA